MNKNIFIRVLGLALTVTALSGCKNIHIHTFNVDFEHNETEHWKTCSTCGEKFMLDDHLLNSLNDKCLICDYVDPIVIVDEEGVLTGLTEHGKEKKIITLPDNVLYVAKDALNDSSVILLNLNKDFIGYYDGAFSKENLVINPYEEEVTWELKGGIYYKHDILKEYDARIDKVYYKTLDEAFAAIKEDEVTVTILKDDLVNDNPVTISHIVTLEAYHSHITLNCDFNITSGGILNIPASIELTSNVKLMLANTREEIEDYYEDVYSSGSIAFVNKEEKPENVFVEYVKSFDEAVGLGYEAVGSKQVVNALLVAVPVTHYAYGTFTFSKDFTSIKGLTYYGQAVSDLYITNVVKNISAVISSYAFAVYTDIKINIHHIDDTHIKFYKTKGAFTSLHLSDGIVAVGEGAFSNWVTTDVFHEVKMQIKILISRISYLEIGESVKSIGYQAFQEQLCIEEIKGGRGLTSIDRFAFYENASLRIVDFSEAYNLKTIEKGAFRDCDSLMNVILPPAGWNVDGNTYLPDQFTPEAVAYYISKSYSDVKWTRGNAGYIAYTTSTDKDGTGRFNRVAYTNDIMTAVNGCADGGWVILLEDTPEEQRHINVTNINKAISIFADPSLEDVTIGEKDKELVINYNCYLTLSNVTPVSDIILKYSEINSFIFNIGSFAIRKDNEERLTLNVYYDSENRDNTKALGVDAVLINDQSYKAYGLFTHIDEYDSFGRAKQQTINGLTRLGNTASGFEITYQYDNAYCQTSTDIILANNVLAGKTQLKHVLLGRNVTIIGDSAFENCAYLKTVKIIETFYKIKLKSIGAKAFKGCVNLTTFSISFVSGTDTVFNYIYADAFTNCPALSWFDFGRSKARNWIVDGERTVRSEELNDCANAARLIKEYSSKVWHW